MCSIFAACRDLSKAPTDQAIRNALKAQLPEAKELERRLNAALATPVPKIVFRRQRDAAVDLTLIEVIADTVSHARDVSRSQAERSQKARRQYASVPEESEWMVFISPTVVFRNRSDLAQRLGVAARFHLCGQRRRSSGVETGTTPLSPYAELAGHHCDQRSPRRIPPQKSNGNRCSVKCQTLNY